MITDTTTLQHENILNALFFRGFSFTSPTR